MLIRTAIAAVLLATAAPAEAQECAPRADMIRTLAERFGEQPVAIGMVGEDRVMELFVGPDGSWSLTATAFADAAPVSCFVGAGQNWTMTNLPPLPGRAS